MLHILQAVIEENLSRKELKSRVFGANEVEEEIVESELEEKVLVKLNISISLLIC